MFDPANNSYNWRYEFTFGHCGDSVVDRVVKHFLPAPARCLIGAVSSAFPGKSGDVDISDIGLRCHCQQYDPELKKTLEDQFGTSYTYSESTAREVMATLRRKMKQLEGDCPDCVAAYNWNNILPTAAERGHKALRRQRPGG